MSLRRARGAGSATTNHNLICRFLEPDVAVFLRKIAEQKGVEVETIVNEWIRRDIALLEKVAP